MYRAYAERPAGPHQPRHPPPARPAAGQRPPPHRADERACCSRCPARRCSTTATRSAWATTSTSATATASARRCSGAPTATPASRRANPQKLYLPVIIDPEYHYEAVNVEAQQNNPHSLLWWMKRLIALRKRYKAFGRGDASSSCTRTTPRSWPSSAGTRTSASWSSPTCRGSCSTSSWTCASSQGLVPVELFGRVEFPPIGERPYPLTLGPHGFYWFALTVPRPIEAARRRAGHERSVPSVRVPAGVGGGRPRQARRPLERAVAGPPARPRLVPRRRPDGQGGRAAGGGPSCRTPAPPTLPDRRAGRVRRGRPGGLRPAAGVRRGAGRRRRAGPPAVQRPGPRPWGGRRASSTTPCTTRA